MYYQTGNRVSRRTLTPVAKPTTLVVTGLLILLAGCAGPAVKRPDLEAHEAQCLDFYHRADALVAEAGVADAESVRLRGFPYLRSDRFLAHMGEELLADAQLEAWLDRLERLDRDARRIEYGNLSVEERRRLALNATSFAQQTAECAAVLRRYDSSESAAPNALQQAARVPPSYSTAQRVFGLYPIASVFLRGGVSRLHRDIHQQFQQPLAELPIQGRLVRYGPPDAVEPLSQREVAALLERAADNPLRIPEPTGVDKRRLLHTFAPVWEVDVATRDDRIGAPGWRDGEPLVDEDRPLVYTRLSHTRFGGRTLLQLNYVIWFPARTRDGGIDLLAGRLDGLVWRVTLAPDGTPLIYDTIHNCGCYHMFFPGERLERIPEADAGQEPLLIPQPPLASASGRLVIRVAAGTHYVQRVYFDAPNGSVTYGFEDYRTLRSLPAGNGHRSLFASNGLVPSSKRGERWFLWPSGVRSPGAMRQWGHHAVAFVGKRHFDDPELMARYFRLTAGTAPFSRPVEPEFKRMPTQSAQ